MSEPFTFLGSQELSIARSRTVQELFHVAKYSLEKRGKVNKGSSVHLFVHVGEYLNIRDEMLVETAVT